MRFSFLHKQNNYTAVCVDTEHSFQERAQLEQQGFINPTQKVVDANGIEEAKDAYLRNMIFGISDSGYMFSLCKNTGREIWRCKPNTDALATLNGSSSVSFSLLERKLVLGGNGFVSCLCAISGAVFWTNSLPEMGFNNVRIYAP
ncbi:hypothetical protein OPW33_17405 [Vibrio europaeus]|uniref:hypothetical protein n=1 Tax=Vibrio europaeus TaxID=300876 RepID=UPI0023419678|nr:hypothetical protein [Vibrio europaeus]MDC5841102.1 hypothetical protein [Vibrio europaeus]